MNNQVIEIKSAEGGYENPEWERFAYDMTESNEKLNLVQDIIWESWASLSTCSIKSNNCFALHG